MGKIFAGFIFVLFNFNINLNNSTIGLIPNFVGYFLILNGIKDLEDNARYFGAACPTAIFFTAYSILTYLLDITGILAGSMASSVFGLVSTAGTLIMAYFVVSGVCCIESEKRVFLNGESLKKIWIVMVMTDVMLYLSLLAPALVVILLFATVVISIIFMVTLYQCRLEYRTVFGK